MISAPTADSFEQVYRTHVRFVWRSLRRLGVPERDVFDAAQEVFVVVHRKLPEFEGRSRLARWIFSICLRVASDRRRSAHARREVLDSDAMPEPADPATAGSQIESREILAQLQSALEPMPMEQRAVFVLFELEEMTGAEIAEMLEVPVATVHSRLRLARDTFRRAAERFNAIEHFDAARLGGG